MLRESALLFLHVGWIWRVLTMACTLSGSVVFLRDFQLAANVALPAQPTSSGRSTPLTPEQLRQLSWQQDSFVPEFLYEAMSENKRFDSMRVRLTRTVFPFRFQSAHVSCILSVCVSVIGRPSRRR